MCSHKWSKWAEYTVDNRQQSWGIDEEKWETRKCYICKENQYEFKSHIIKKDF